MDLAARHAGKPLRRTLPSGAAWSAAERGSLADFLAVYEPGQATTERMPGGSTLLFRAMSNPDPRARVAIANQLLDDGADASVVTAPTSDSGTVLHALWSVRRERDIPAEADLLARLLDGGADVNHRSPRFGLPIIAMIQKAVIAGDDLLAIWVVVVDHSRPDLSLDVNGTPLGTWLLFHPVLAEPARAYATASGQTIRER